MGMKQLSGGWGGKKLSLSLHLPPASLLPPFPRPHDAAAPPLRAPAPGKASAKAGAGGWGGWRHTAPPAKVPLPGALQHGRRDVGGSAWEGADPQGIVSRPPVSPGKFPSHMGAKFPPAGSSV